MNTRMLNSTTNSGPQGTPMVRSATTLAASTAPYCTSMPRRPKNSALSNTT